jgi:fluoride exporter
MIVVWVALAGGAGAIARYVVDGQVKQRWPVTFPIGTMAINLSGSLILGVLAGLVIAHGASVDLKTIAGTGFCGGYTTFSAASVEAVRLAQQQRWVACLTYAGGSVVLAVLAVALGLAIVGA